MILWLAFIPPPRHRGLFSRTVLGLTPNCLRSSPNFWEAFWGEKLLRKAQKISIRHKAVHEIDLTSNHFPVSTKFIKLFKLSQNYYQNEWYSSEKSFRAPEKYHLPLFFLNYKTFIWDIEWFLCRELKHNFHKQSSRVCVCGGCVCVCVRVCGVLGHGMGVCVCVC